MKDNEQQHVDPLLDLPHAAEVTRRGFMVSTLAMGFALAVRPGLGRDNRHGCVRFDGW